jgi:autotransporter-associated beta strand protein
VVNGGFLSVSADGDLGAVPGSPVVNNITLNGGGLLAGGSFTLNANRGITLSGTGLLDAASGVTFTIGSPVIGANGIMVNSGGGDTGTVLLNAADTFSGTAQINAGTLQLGNALSLQNATVGMNGGLLDFNALTAATVGGLSGSGNLTLQNTAGTGAAVALTIGNNNTTATYTGILGGSGSVSMEGAGTITIGSGGSGGASYTGNTLVDEGALLLGGVGNMSAAQINITGNTAASAATFADSAQAAFSGAILIGTSGSNTPNPATATVKNNAVVSAASLSFGNGTGRPPAGTGLTVQDSASLSITGNFDLNAEIGGSGYVSDNAVNLNGGTLAVGAFVFSSVSATHSAVVHFNGGVLKANASSAAFLPAVSGLTVDVDSGGAIINPNGNAITITQPLVHGTGTPDSGLILNGNGTLTLAGANTYIGTTSVSKGALLVTGSIGTNTVTVTNATLGGTGTIGGATLMQSNAVLAAGISGTGTLTFGSTLALDPHSTNIFAVTTANGASNKVAVVGALTPNNSVIQIASGTPLGFTTNTLFTYGSISGSFNTNVMFDVPPVHHPSIVDDGAGHINLVVSETAPVAGATFTNYVTLGAPSTVQIVGGKYAPTDADGDVLTITITGAPANGTAGTDGTNITYTATGGTSDSLTYTVSDGFGGTATQTIYYVISGPAPSQNQLAPTMVAGQQVLNFAGIPNYNYALDETHDLTPPITWTPVITNTVGPSGKLLFTNAPSGGNDYYRTRYVP